MVWGNQIFITSAISSKPGATFKPGLYGDGDASDDSSPHKFMLYAVDKRTGKQVGAVVIPSKTSAPPMTFLHKGKQYIVFATGGGANTSLVALTLPSGPGSSAAGGGR